MHARMNGTDDDAVQLVRYYCNYVNFNLEVNVVSTRMKWSCIFI
jgi:hypothetical protein